MTKPWQPWEESSKWKTKSEFFQWLRGQIRKSIWQHYPPRNEYKASMLRPVTQDDFNNGISKRTKKVGQCVFCEQWFPASKLQVDHKVSAGSLRDESDILDFVKRMACMKDDMRLTCHDCHTIRTYQEKHDISWQDACIEKQYVIPFSKLSAYKQKEILKHYDQHNVHAKDRREVYRQYIKQSGEK